jgi:hypothetical protein
MKCVSWLGDEGASIVLRLGSDRRQRLSTFCVGSAHLGKMPLRITGPSAEDVALEDEIALDAFTKGLEGLQGFLWPAFRPEPPIRPDGPPAASDRPLATASRSVASDTGNLTTYRAFAELWLMWITRTHTPLAMANRSGGM